VAKSFHFENSTGIDFNRAGTPLMEIVTRPEINSPEEAFAFLTALKQILIYAAVSDADMEKGQLRCDCNISVRPESQTELGAKIEIKNLNSISGVRRALAYEVRRQIAALENAETLQQETRGWNDATGETFLMRTKEFAHDYRYFPDPDLVPVKTEILLAEVRQRVPELPNAKRARFVRQYQVSPYDAAVLANDLNLARYFETAAKGAKKPKNIANWVLNDLQNALSIAGKAINDCPIPPEALDELVDLIDSFVVDTGNKYLSKMYDDFWMAEQGFIHRAPHGDLSDLISHRYEAGEVVSVGPSDTLLTAFKRMRDADVSQVPVVDQHGRAMGILDESDVLVKVHRDASHFNDLVKNAMTSKLETLSPSATIKDLLSVFDRGRVAIVMEDDKFLGLVTRSDLLSYLRLHMPKQ
jgi:aspartyl/glutamyl-tRNA(Asn/Gln) amidotransferase B subunit